VIRRDGTLFRDPAAAEAGGYTLAIAGLLVAGGLLFHPLPAGGFAEQAGVLARTPWWGAIHVAIAAGCVLCALGGLLVLIAARTGTDWVHAFCWGAFAVGMFFFTGVALINGWVMDRLAVQVASGGNRDLFDAFNSLLVGYGWLGNPLFLLGLSGIAALEVRDRLIGMPRWLALAGLLAVLLSWLRGVGSALGVPFLEPFILANIPAFLWLSVYGLRLARGRSSFAP
jgi:hypothetical protein